ncbi:enolase C-terminal domain-like protein [Marispirochaeta aestuarii]|uniref:enolase C-terminal domain-like protein n=1 Tax=Marispirochaeta aestuarii TaxID=1963862 RepID=UPI0029C6A884|nr:enolase C-terminal domain-like protein [Marispirochaeta aestuarii]
MKIINVETYLFRSSRNYLLVKIETDDGIVGWGDATLNGREMVVQILVDNYLKDLLVGTDASKINEIWQMIYIGTYWRGGPIMMTALAGVDMALWDIKGKYAEMPLVDLIGGRFREKVEVYSHVHGRNADELVESVKRKKAEGFRNLRYSFDSRDHHSDMIFTQPHQDIVQGHFEKSSIESLADFWDSRVYAQDLIRITDRLRKEFGMTLGLIHDVHGRLSLSAAKEVCRELEKMHLMFIEDPIDSKKTNGLEEIRNTSTTPIGIGELFNSIDECRALISKHHIDYLRIDISHFGGITPSLKAAALSDVFDVKMAFHGPSDISPVAHAACYHIDSSISNFGIQEYVDFEQEVKDVFKMPYTYDNGFVTINNTPGLGVEIDENQLMECDEYMKSYLPILRDMMSAIHNW